MKADLQLALQAEGIFPGGTPSAPVFITTIPSDVEAQRPAPDPDQVGRWYYNTDTHTIQRDNGTSWDDLTPPTSIIPSGTVMIFFETAAPTSWTQITSGIGDRLMRVTTGATGGTATAGDSIAGPPIHGHTTQSAYATHSHTLTEDVLVSVDSTPVAPINVLTSIPSPTATADVSHYHDLAGVTAFSPKYQDFIVCTKN